MVIGTTKYLNCNMTGRSLLTRGWTVFALKRGRSGVSVCSSITHGDWRSLPL